MSKSTGYRLQILDPNGRVAVSWPAGHHIETDLIEAIVQESKTEGIGLFRTEAQVEAAIRVGVARAIRGLKQGVTPHRRG